MHPIGLAALAAVACLAFSGAVPAQEGRAVPERKVELPAETGLVVGHQARQGRAVLVELVPAGESVQRYTRMVTLQTMPGMGGISEGEILGRFTDLYRARCPKSTSAPLAPSGIRIDCPLHPATGRMETVFARALDLAPDGAIVHITLTTLPMPADSRWARDYLARVAVR